MKFYLAIFTLLIAGLHAEDYDGIYEERPSLGFYAEWTQVDDLEFTYREIPNPGRAKSGALDSGDSLTAIYRLKGDLEVTPLMGVGGHLPFLWNNYVNATMVVGFQKHTYNLTSDDPRTVDAGTNNKTMESYTVVIQGGPEVGYPIYTDFKTQQLFKVFGFGQVIIGKTFLDSESNFQNDAYWGVNWGLGARYAVHRMSFSLGVKNAEWLWKPVYQEDVGNIDESLGEGLVNKMRVRYSQKWNLYLDIKYALF